MRCAYLVGIPHQRFNKVSQLTRRHGEVGISRLAAVCLAGRVGDVDVAISGPVCFPHCALRIIPRVLCRFLSALQLPPPRRDLWRLAVLPPRARKVGLDFLDEQNLLTVRPGTVLHAGMNHDVGLLEVAGLDEGGLTLLPSALPLKGEGLPLGILGVAELANGSPVAQPLHVGLDFPQRPPGPVLPALVQVRNPDQDLAVVVAAVLGVALEGGFARHAVIIKPRDTRGILLRPLNRIGDPHVVWRLAPVARVFQWVEIAHTSIVTDHSGNIDTAIIIGDERCRVFGGFVVFERHLTRALSNLIVRHFLIRIGVRFQLFAGVIKILLGLKLQFVTFYWKAIASLESVFDVFRLSGLPFLHDLDLALPHEVRNVLARHLAVLRIQPLVDAEPFDLGLLHARHLGENRLPVLRRRLLLLGTFDRPQQRRIEHVERALIEAHGPFRGLFGLDRVEQALEGGIDPGTLPAFRVGLHLEQLVGDLVVVLLVGEEVVARLDVLQPVVDIGLEGPRHQLVVR